MCYYTTGTRRIDTLWKEQHRIQAEAAHCYLIKVNSSEYEFFVIPHLEKQCRGNLLKCILFQQKLLTLVLLCLFGCYLSL